VQVVLARAEERVSKARVHLCMDASIIVLSDSEPASDVPEWVSGDDVASTSGADNESVGFRRERPSPVCHEAQVARCSAALRGESSAGQEHLREDHPRWLKELSKRLELYLNLDFQRRVEEDELPSSDLEGEFSALSLDVRPEKSQTDQLALELAQSRTQSASKTQKTYEWETDRYEINTALRDRSFSSPTRLEHSQYTDTSVAFQLGMCEHASQESVAKRKYAREHYAKGCVQECLAGVRKIGTRTPVSDTSLSTMCRSGSIVMPHTAIRWKTSHMTMIIRCTEPTQKLYKELVPPTGSRLFMEPLPVEMDSSVVAVIQWQANALKSASSSAHGSTKHAIVETLLPFVVICVEGTGFLARGADRTHVRTLVKAVTHMCVEGTKTEILIRYTNPSESLARSVQPPRRGRHAHRQGTSAAPSRGCGMTRQFVEMQFVKLSTYFVEECGIDLTCVTSIDHELEYISALSEALLELPLELEPQPNGAFRIQYAPEDLDLQAAARSDSLRRKKSVLRERQPSETELECMPNIDKRILLQLFLSSIPFVSEDTANAISTAYPSLGALYRAYESCPDDQTRRALLAKIPVQRSIGAGRVRRIGPALSGRIFELIWRKRGESLVSLR
jgi:hypothetical protein